MLTAPASAASSRIFSTCSGASLIPGISGATSTPVGIPARLSSPTASSLARGDLDDDFALGVAARVEVEVGVCGAGEAVVADDAVGDEVAGAGGDVVELELESERLD